VDNQERIEELGLKLTSQEWIRDLEWKLLGKV